MVRNLPYSLAEMMKDKKIPFTEARYFDLNTPLDGLPFSSTGFFISRVVF